MGKKKGGGAQKKQLTEDDFDALLDQVSAAFEKNADVHEQRKQQVAPKGKAKQQERKEKKQQILKAQEEKRKEQMEQEAQWQRLMHAMRQQMMNGGGMNDVYMEEAVTEKHSEHAESDKFAVSVVGMQGWRRTMEDSHIVSLPKKDGVGLFGVFDGHAGDDVAMYTAEHLEEVIRGQPAYKKGDYKDALEKAFLELDADMQAKELGSGCTATLCLVDTKNNTVFCANAGDSRAVMCYDGKCTELSEDHKPDSEVETARIEAAGGTVETPMGGIPRVNGCLAVSRGFGDFTFKGKADLAPEAQVVTCFPDVTSFPLDKTEYLVVACDGIWDCLSSEELIENTRDKVAAAKTPEDLTKITSEVFDSILAPNPSMIGSDNMTMSIVKFK